MIEQLVRASMRVVVCAGLALVLAPMPAAGAGAQAAAAQDPELEARTRTLAAQLRCPVCQGLSIADSPTELAEQMKSVIREQLAAGRTPDEVKAYFVERYGEWILLEPEPRGFNLTVYLLPFVALLIGGGVIVAVVRRWTRRGRELAEQGGVGAGAAAEPLDPLLLED